MSTEKKLPKLLTASQLAEQLDVPLWTVRALTRRGCPVIKLGTKFFFNADSVAAWLSEQQLYLNSR